MAATNDELVPYEDAQIILAKNDLDINIGDRFIKANGSHDNTVYTVIGFRKAGNRREGAPDFQAIMQYHYGSSENYRTTHAELSELKADPNGHRVYYKLPDSYENLEAEALKHLLDGEPEDNTAVTSNETSLVANDGGKRLTQVRAELQTKYDRSIILKEILARKVAAMYQHVHAVQKQLSYTYKVIQAVETYLGVYEEIFQIKDGFAASADEPITIRQAILYMDEEAADISLHLNDDGEWEGIDFQTVEEFDAWIVSNDNWRFIVPEPKCIVAMRPTRHERNYSDDDWVNARLNQKNHYVYLIIRNGDKLYRIWTDLTLQETLYPTEKSQVDMAKEFERWYRDEYYQKEAELSWKQQVLMLQGLIDRTDILHPVRELPNLFDPTSYEKGLVRMIRDAEPTISDGRISWREWKAQMIDSIERGTRLYVGHIGYNDMELGKRHQWLYHNTLDHSYPDPGVYTVETYERKETGRHYVDIANSRETEPSYRREYTVLYAPRGYNVYSRYSTSERQRRVSFTFREGDGCFLNYDTITLDECNRWIGDRLARKDYTNYLPLMLHIRQVREQELYHERQFVNLVASNMDCDAGLVWKGVDWWKRKVINKRPIANDDAKAWRMIRKWVNRKIENANA